MSDFSSWVEPHDKGQSSMLQLLHECNIPQETHADFESYSPAEFGVIALSLEELNDFIQELALPAFVSSGPSANTWQLRSLQH